MDEIWKDIPGYEGVYQVSSQGRVRSLDRVVVYRNGRRQLCRGKILKPSRVYNYVSLSHDGQSKRISVQRLFVLAFHGPCPPSQVVLQRPRGKSVNSPAAKLTEADIPIIRSFAQSLYQHEIARLFGISQATVNMILNGKAWSHVG